MNRADEKWVELARQQKARGIPLLLRTAGNERAAQQTDALMPKYTAEKFAFWQPLERLSPNQCQRCGQELVTDQARKKLVRKVYRADHKTVSFYIGDCCVS